MNDCCIKEFNRVCGHHCGHKRRHHNFLKWAAGNLIIQCPECLHIITVEEIKTQTKLDEEKRRKERMRN